MDMKESIQTITEVAHTRMDKSAVGEYVSTVISFCIKRLTERKAFNVENLEKELALEAESHLNCQATKKAA